MNPMWGLKNHKDLLETIKTRSCFATVFINIYNSLSRYAAIYIVECKDLNLFFGLAPV
jgi:hypothetical protein